MLTDPTTGGVTASFAMLGDLNIAEPKALIGFAGPRVIEQTIRQKLPEGFQRSEFLLEKGMLDLVVDRREMRSVIANALRFMGAKRSEPAAAAVTELMSAGVAGAPAALAALEAIEPAQTASVTDPLSYLFGLGQFGIKFGLENMFAIVGRLGHPERTFRSVHIAGTNGKGSVTAMIDAGLRAAGHRSARYTSPHLVDLAERFVIDGRPVGCRQDAGRGRRRSSRRSRQLLAEGVLQAHPTFFEVTTAVAFELFRRAGVDAAVLEVGLGGRLDATNVIQPIATAITSIAYDHQQYLGSTLAEIAREKAGIIKPGVPMVVGELEPEAFAAIAGIARDRGAPLIRAAEGVTITPARVQHHRASHARARLRRDHDGPAGEHQIGNALVAVRILELLDAQGMAVPPDAVVSALARPSWPGRLDLAPDRRRPRRSCSTRPTIRPARPRSRPTCVSSKPNACRSSSPACRTRISKACCALFCRSWDRSS